METLSPVYLRTPDNGFAFPATPECNITAADIVIPDGADVIWDSPRRLRSNVLVETGGKLTVNCDLGLPKNATITVQKNAELIVNGARIYNNCNGDFWYGIVVEGDSDEHQVKIGGIRNQGYVRTNPGTVIEGAFTGVSLFALGSPQQTAGGVISASGTTFLNNTVGVNFARYQNYSPFTGQPIGNASRFSSCQFVVDQGISGGLANFSSMVTMRGVDGITFSGCIFANNYPTAQATFADEMGFGILAYDAGFSVQGRCLGSQLPCQSYQRPKFSGFYTAIYAQRTGSTANTFRVSRTDFEDNARGIVSSSVHNIYVALNTFQIGMDLPYNYGITNPFVGIQVLRGTGFKIEENNLSPTMLTLPDGIEAVGINIISAGEEPNEVYKNNLNGLYTGDLANGKNRSPFFTDIGLQHLCNSNSFNEFDIAVPSSNWSSGSIAGNQGSSNLAAGNTFTAMPIDPEGHILNAVAPINYFFFTGGEPINVTPIPNVIKVFSGFNSCPSRLKGKKDGIISETDKQQAEADFYNATESSEKAYAANVLIRQALVDTNGVNLSEARVWLANKGGLEASFASVDTWLHEGDDTAALQALNGIPNNFVLAGEDLIEYNHFNTYKNIQINALQNGVDDTQMLLANQAAITQIADAGSYYASIQAQNLINSVQGITYEPQIVLPERTPPPQQLIAPPAGTISTISETDSYVTALPNPAKTKTVFSYRLPDGNDRGQIKVSAIDGRTVKVLELIGNKGQVTWNIGQIPEGIYLFSLVASNKATLTQRLSIIH